MSRKGLFWLTVLEASIHDTLFLFISGLGQGRTSWQEHGLKYKTYLTTKEQKRERGSARIPQSSL
jgi:hypothetical protein